MVRKEPPLQNNPPLPLLNPLLLVILLLTMDAEEHSIHAIPPNTLAVLLVTMLADIVGDPSLQQIPPPIPIAALLFLIVLPVMIGEDLFVEQIPLPPILSAN